MKNTIAFGSHSATGPIEKLEIQRRELFADDINIRIHFCGICHSDIHTVRSEWGAATYPCVPGHEIVGQIESLGKKVKKFKVGDLVGVGCLVGSCGKCGPCKSHLQQFCDAGAVWTYNSKDKKTGQNTLGGYSSHIVVNEKFVLKIAKKNIGLDKIAPLLCAGVTTYSPLKRYKITRGSRVAVVGLGGLGHMGVKLAKAMGAEVTVISTSISKQAESKRLGAKHFVVSKDAAQMQALREKFDFILDTVSAPHELAPLIDALKMDGTLCLVGVPPEELKIRAGSLINKRKRITGSLIGGLKETQEMLDFCQAKKIGSDIEVIAPTEINKAYERVISSDVRYRFVVDFTKA
jgi:alcohol dehydrogenase (NADP+)